MSTMREEPAQARTMLGAMCGILTAAAPKITQAGRSSTPFLGGITMQPVRITSFYTSETSSQWHAILFFYSRQYFVLCILLARSSRSVGVYEMG